MRTLLTLTMLLGCVSLGAAQQKNEREERLKDSRVPHELVDQLAPFTKNIRVKYFYETDGPNASYEAKFKSKSRSFSVEFDTLGVLEDVEIDIKFNSIDKKKRNKILSYLKKTSTNHKILKCQVQYKHDSGPSEVTLRHAVFNEEHTPINYEIEVNMLIDKLHQSFELLFDASGELISKREIVNRAVDNILY